VSQQNRLLELNCHFEVLVAALDLDVEQLVLCQTFQWSVFKKDLAS
jgi:hypothetical protein